MSSSDAQNAAEVVAGATSLLPMVEQQSVGTAGYEAFEQSRWVALCKQLHQEALQGSGLSHDVFTGRYSEGIDRAVERLPPTRRLRALRLAKLHGDYSTPQERTEALRWNAENGCCSHGITLGCCPAGCDVPDDYDEDIDDYIHDDFEAEPDAREDGVDEHASPFTSSPSASLVDGPNVGGNPSNHGGGTLPHPLAPEISPVAHALKRTSCLRILVLLALVSMAGFGTLALMS